jgi:hypothetical protein
MPPEGIDSLNAKSLKGLVLSLLARIDVLVARVDELLEQNKMLLEQNKTLQARIAELEGRGGKPPKTPTNSSLPPSSGQKANVADASGKKKGRKGHPGVARELCPNPDVTRDIFAERCTCGGKAPRTGQVLAHAPLQRDCARSNTRVRERCRICKRAVQLAFTRQFAYPRLVDPLALRRRYSVISLDPEWIGLTRVIERGRKPQYDTAVERDDRLNRTLIEPLGPNYRGALAVFQSACNDLGGRAEVQPKMLEGSAHIWTATLCRKTLSPSGC